MLKASIALVVVSALSLFSTLPLAHAGSCSSSSASNSSILIRHYFSDPSSITSWVGVVTANETSFVLCDSVPNTFFGPDTDFTSSPTDPSIQAFGGVAGFAQSFARFRPSVSDTNFLFSANSTNVAAGCFVPPASCTNRIEFYSGVVSASLEYTFGASTTSIATVKYDPDSTATFTGTADFSEFFIAVAISLSPSSIDVRGLKLAIVGGNQIFETIGFTPSGGSSDYTVSTSISPGVVTTNISLFYFDSLRNDLDGDNRVTESDLAIFEAAIIAQTWSFDENFDFNGDGDNDAADVALLAAALGAGIKSADFADVNNNGWIDACDKIAFYNAFGSVYGDPDYDIAFDWNLDGVIDAIDEAEFLSLFVEGDTNGDGVVNFADLNTVLSQLGQSGIGLSGDLNCDGTVNFTDLNIVNSNL